MTGLVGHDALLKKTYQFDLEVKGKGNTRMYRTHCFKVIYISPGTKSIVGITIAEESYIIIS